ncbi:MAG: cell division protein ZapD [Rhodocyclaceae bacterium]|nr:cell division protein ZapD [Rhodocyclaceae bacterium]
MVTYEHPLNERIRTLLRLEDLFAKATHFLRGSTSHEHHAALMGLFEILDVARRADLKFDLLQELERQRQILISFRNNPDISEEALSGALYEIEQANSSLLSMAGKVGQYLRDNEWLMSIKNRSNIPGGVCEFDLPSYHYWLHQDSAGRQTDLEGWLAPILPIRDGIAIVLRLLRASGRGEPLVATKGTFQLMLAGRSAQMLRLQIQENERCTPEISANKYAINIRFTDACCDARSRQVENDVAFRLTFCNL